MHPVARFFDQTSATYERARPGYPPEAVEHIVQRIAHTRTGVPAVLDLAAGTGKFTRLLAAAPGARGWRIEAVEPSAPMREQFAQAVPASVRVLGGTADAIAFDAGTFDAVTVAQAFHWFANDAAVREMHRVLCTDGLLVLLWNLEDAAVPWMARVRELYERHDDSIPQYRRGLWRAALEPANAGAALFALEKHAAFRWSTRSTRATVWERIFSKSYITRLAPDVQAELHAQVDAVLREVHGDDADEIDAPFVTDVFVYVRRDLPAAP